MCANTIPVEKSSYMYLVNYIASRLPVRESYNKTGTVDPLLDTVICWTHFILGICLISFYFKHWLTNK